MLSVVCKMDLKPGVVEDKFDLVLNGVEDREWVKIEGCASAS
jgi:hypothetical protein